MYLVTHLYVFAFLPIAILISVFNTNKIPIFKQRFVTGLFAIVGKKLKVSGLDNIQKEKAYVIISNYPSFYAGFALIGVFPYASIVAHAFIKKVPVLGQALSRAGVIFVQPGGAGSGIRALDKNIRFDKTGSGVIILPEGARTPNGNIHSFKRGFIYILRHTTLDLLPVTLNGFYQLKPMKRFYADPDAEPEMMIHAPLKNSILRQMDDIKLLEKVRNIIGEAYRP